ncbi:MAG: KpsF/GutQ family sugar-phosphate isomerase [Culturomica sp.]|jgi:arabinose-5-phosphate isomerase|nr:KpsF/GutQ family sugar-phosphate isomerase [Culturomica sp.]
MIDIQQIAKNVVLEEASVVANLASHINEDFEKVVRLIHNAKGRVIITGIGKSAIIAQKIVATLNSTGTPSIFLHAADAIHGDMGMVLPEDIVIFISKSGNTPEIKMLLPLIKGIGNDNLVAMVGNTDSFLAKNAAYIIYTEVEKEACPNNLAPTNSTTAQLVMGDALAICLIRLRSFSSGDFAKFHPGGSLGKRLYTRVSDIYDKARQPKVNPDDSIKKIIIEISKGRFGAVVVTDQNNEILGIITDGDLRRMLEKHDNINTLKAKDIMSVAPKTTFEDELAYNVYLQMKKNSITQLIITDENNKYKGIVHIHDILREGIV